MKFVEIYKLENSGEQRVVLRCVLNEAGAVDLHGEAQQLAKNLTDRGIVNHFEKTPETLFPSDGLPFLENLSQYLNSAYLCASLVKEE